MALIVTAMVLWLELPHELLLTASLGYTAMMLLILRYWPREYRRFGWANRLTLLRGSLIMVVTGSLLFEELVTHHPLLVTALVMAALVMDGLDGWVARHLKLATAFGARFDMELDAFLILMLCVLLVVQEMAGPWVIMIGALRYLFLLAMHYLPLMARPLPLSHLRKTICVWQVMTLMTCLLPWVTPPVSQVLLGLALLLLLGSFSRDIRWLYRRRKAMTGKAVAALPAGRGARAVGSWPSSQHGSHR
ncbi:CDP-alcohol phosphatidyltransferase family protein [Kushneria sinocarnis]|nr:CDP-alcohol phosphatidyltransferase family protein [Kushneria sinocarnis]